MTFRTLQMTLNRNGNGAFDVSALQGSVAAVMVTARFRTCKLSDGSLDKKIDKTVDLTLQSIADATSLEGALF